MVTGVRSTQAPGPLVVSSTNPRYFTAAAAPDEAVYLTGSHVNNNVHDGLGTGSDCPEDPERFDFNAYLELLTERGHNFIRLWRWEQFRGQLAQANVHFCMTPQPWPRTDQDQPRTGSPSLICRPSIRAISIGFANALGGGLVKYPIEWHSLRSRDTVPGAALTIPDDSKIDIGSPSEVGGPAVVHPRRISS